MEPGELVDDTYRIERSLGGAVYLARDLRLHRDVAIKLHDAAAMAKLRHPHVVAIYGLGSWAGQPYVAMEYVSGGTLASWRTAQPRAPREIVARFAGVGRALAAAHAAGLVHRDLQPDRILVGQDGRVQVADLVAATPDHGPADDQRAFAAVLHDALGSSRAPRKVRAAIDRARTAGFASMDALVDAIDVRPRRALVLAIAGVAVIAALAAVLWLRRTDRDPAARCRAGVSLAGAWDDARRAGVERAFLATGKANAADTFRRTAGHLDDYGAAWKTARIEACRATGPSATVRDLRTSCLERRRASLGAITELFAAGPDPELLDRAIGISSGLEDLADCADLATLAGAPPLPAGADARAAIARLFDAIAHADALRAAGRFDDALRAGTEAMDGARATGYAPVLALSLRVLASAQIGAGDHTAKATLREAARVAAEARDDRGVVAVWAQLLNLLVAETRELDEADALVPTLEAALARAGRQPLIQIVADSNIGALRTAQGRYDEARTLLEHALATAEHELPPDAPVLTQVLNRLAAVLSRQGEPDDARRYLERAIALQEQQLGPEHPYLAMSLHNLGGTLFRSGDYEEAVAVYHRALAMKEKLLGPDHRDLTKTLADLGLTLRNLGRYAEARAPLERSVAIGEATLGPDHATVGAALISLAGVVEALDGIDVALPMLERGLAILEAKLGPDHPDVGRVLLERGMARVALGDLEAARADIERGLGILRDRLGPDHPDVAGAIAALADLHALDGKLDAARAEYEQARAISVAGLDEDSPRIARIESALGELEVRAGRLPEARAWFVAALERIAGSGPDRPELVNPLIGLAMVDAREGNDASAQAQLERAIAILEAASGPHHPSLADPLTELARVHLHQHHAAEALAAAERAVAVRAGHRIAPDPVADTAAVLAEARAANR